MNIRKTYTADELQGPNIYKDTKGRTVYCDRFMKKGRVITNSYANEYYNYSLRMFGALLLATLIMMIWKNSYLLATIVGVGFYLITTLLFYFRFLRKLPETKDFIKEKRDNYIVFNAKDYTYGRLIAIIILLMLIALILYSWIQKYDAGLLRYAMIILTALVIAFTLLNIVTLFYKIIKNPKKENDA